MLQNCLVGSPAPPSSASQLPGPLHHGSDSGLVLCHHCRPQIWDTWPPMSTEWWVSSYHRKKKKTVTLSFLCFIQSLIGSVCFQQWQFDSDVSERASPHPPAGWSLCWILLQSAGRDPQHELCLVSHRSGMQWCKGWTLLFLWLSQWHSLLWASRFTDCRPSPAIQIPSH